MATDDTAITLYGHPRSGNAYKAALMLALTDTPWQFRLVDLPGGEQRGAQYRALNLFGKVPMLVHGDRVIRQSNTILVHLASHTGRFGAGDPQRRLRVSEWLFWEQEALFPGVGRSRFFARVQPAPPAVMDWFRAIGEAALDTLESGLAEDAFLAGSEPTIADLATYSYARLAEEANFDLTARPRVRAWREAIEALPGWSPPATLMPA